MAQLLGVGNPSGMPFSPSWIASLDLIEGAARTFVHSHRLGIL
jgi:hypothetical protein